MSETIAEESVSKELEREAITALIMSDKALNTTRPYLEPALFSNFMTKNVMQWCCDFYDQYGKSPKLHIRDLYEEHKEKVDETTSDLIELFLSSISDTFASLDSYNEDFATSRLVDYLNMAKVQVCMDDAGDLIDKGDPKKLVELMEEYQPISATEDIICDYDSMLKLAEDRLEQPPLFEFPGAMGDVLGPISRSSFTAILSPEKRGKSQFMLYFAKLAAKKHRRVLFISAGDMTLEEISERGRLAATGMNQKLREKKTVFQPCLDCMAAQDGSCTEYDFTPVTLDNPEKMSPQDALEMNPDHTPCTHCRRNEDPHIRKQFKPTVWWREVEMLPVSKETVNKALQEHEAKFRKLCGKNGDVKFVFFPTKTCTPEKIESLLKRLSDNGWPVDVLVVDYMDILAAPARARRMDERNQINATWEEMRRISQVYNLALITATQGVRDMYKSDADQGSTSEDKRKAAHVTLMFALNQKPYEKEQGIIRLNVLFKRDGDDNMMNEVTVLNCFSLGKVNISNYLSRKKFSETAKKKPSRSGSHFKK